MVPYLYDLSIFLPSTAAVMNFWLCKLQNLMILVNTAENIFKINISTLFSKFYGQILHYQIIFELARRLMTNQTVSKIILN